MESSLITHKIISGLFTKPALKNLTSNDFILNTEEKLKLKDKNCCVVLFHNHNGESVYTIDLFDCVAKKTIGPIFMICDLTSQNEIDLVFKSMLSNSDNNSHLVKLEQIPIIVSYKNGIPQNVYNGNMIEHELFDYIADITCSSDYK